MIQWEQYKLAYTMPLYSIIFCARYYFFIIIVEEKYVEGRGPIAIDQIIIVLHWTLPNDLGLHVILIHMMFHELSIQNSLCV